MHSDPHPRHHPTSSMYVHRCNRKHNSCSGARRPRYRGDWLRQRSFGSEKQVNLLFSRFEQLRPRSSRGSACSQASHARCQFCAFLWNLHHCRLLHFGRRPFASAQAGKQRGNTAWFSCGLEVCGGMLKRS